MKTRFHCLVLFFILLTSSSISLGQILPFRTYTTRDGLVSSAATAIVQDSRGYIWIGSYNGLSIFDGVTFKNHSPSEGLPASHISHFVESKRTRNVMWVGTFGGGLLKFADGKFQQYRIGANELQNQVRSLAEDHRGVLWVGTSDGIFLLRDNELTRFDSAAIIGPVMQMVETPDSLIWISPFNQSVLCFSLAGNRTTHIDISHISRKFKKQPQLIAKDDRGNLWVSDRGRMILNVAGTRIIKQIEITEATLGHQAILPDRNGNIWFGTVKGVVKLVPGKSSSYQVVRYGIENGLPENHVLPAMFDFEGNLWMQSFSKGVVKLTDESTVSFKLTAAPYVMNNATARVDRHGRFWVSTPEGFWEIWRTAEGNWRSHIHPTSDESKYGFPNALFVDRQGRLWAKYWRGLLACYRVQTQTNQPSHLQRVVDFLPGVHFPNGQYNCFLVDHAGRIWYGIEDKGIALLDPQRTQPLVRIIKPEDGLADLTIRAMYEDHEGKILLGGMTGGLFVVRPSARGKDTIVQYTVKDGLPSNSLNVFWEDQKRTLWIGTRGGRIATMVKGTITPVPEVSTFRNSTVWAIGEGKDGTLWVGTQKGLVTFDKRTFAASVRKTELMGSPVYACGVAESGLVWMVSDEGFKAMDPALVNTASVPPLVHITRFSVSGQDVEQRAGLEFSSTENNCVVEFVGISFRSERDLNYEYKLEPADAVWRAPTSNRSVSFAALKPGSYRFTVRAITGEGRASAEPASLQFTVLPPFWQTWWFLTLTTLALAGVLGGVYRYRVNRLLELERLRSRIATDLHDEIGSTLSGISVLSETAKRAVAKKTPKAAQNLDRIGSSARMMLEAMDDIVWAINPENDSLDNFTLRLREFATELFEAKKIKFDLLLPEQTNMALPMETRRNLYLILKEAITNIVKHAKCRRADITMQVTNNLLNVTVYDDGIGLSTANGVRGNGLANMQNRADAIGAKLGLRSQKGKGTTISFSMKIT